MVSMKKMSYLLGSAILAFSLTACSSSTTNSNPAPEKPSGNAQQPQAKEPSSSGTVTEDKKIIIKFGHGSAESNARHKAALKFKELVEQKSNGQMEVQVYHSEQLGSESAMVQSVQSNLIQMTAGGTGIFAAHYKNIGVIELPYVFENFEQAWKVLDGPFGKEISDPLIEQGIRIISFWENGFRHITNNVKPIEKPEDLQGIKIRTPEIPVSLSIFNTLGANAVSMNFGELFQALEQNVVDGQENPLTNIYASKFYEVQKYASLTGHQYSPLPLAISDKFWQTLTPDQQKIIEESAKEAGQLHRDLVKQDDQNLKAELEKNGMKINEPDKQPFKEAVKPVYKEFEGVYGKELIDKLFKAAEEVK